jgi:hypothetical protein
LCAMAQCSLRDARDLHQRELLAMIARTLVVLSATELHNDFLFALSVAFDRGADLCACDERCADLEVRAISNEQHFIERHGRAGRCVEFLDLQQTVFLNPVLLSTGGNYGVHLGTDSIGKAAHSNGPRAAGQTGFGVISPGQTATCISLERA